MSTASAEASRAAGGEDGRSRSRDRWRRTLLVAGILLASIVVAAGGDQASGVQVSYVFFCVCAFSLFSRGEAWAFLGLIIGAYLAAIAASAQPLERVPELVLVAVTATASGVVVRFAREQERARVASLTAAVKSLTAAARRDPLTGLLNRRGFEEGMESEIARSGRSGASFALVVGDLDGFKPLNDRLGHLGGDMALERAAGVISRTKRVSDSAVRLGGDEFAMILPDGDAEAGRAFAERLRAAVERSFAGTASRLTISLGVASFPADGRSAEELLGAADRAMYAAKALGKNRVVVHSGAVGLPGGELAPERPSERGARTPTEAEALAAAS
jgi:diguanylate cyclase (GGDEF)-like protein